MMTRAVALAILLVVTFGCGRPRVDAYADVPPPNRILVVPDQYSTIQAAVTAAGVGDRILVRPGTYTGTVAITGATRNHLQIIAEGGEGQVILQGNHTQQTTGTCKFAVEPLCPERAGFFLRDVAGTIIRGFTVRDFGVGPMSGIGEGFLLVNAHRNRIERNVVTRTDMMGITLFNSSQNLVARNTFYGNDPDEPMRVGTGCGVHIQTSAALSAGVAEQNIIRRNVMYGNPFAAVMLYSAGSGNQIVDNELRDGGAWGVTSRNTSGALIENNHITNHTGFKLAGKPRPVGSGVGIDIASSSGAVIKNNRLQNNSTFDIEWDGSGQNAFTGNLCMKTSHDRLCEDAAQKVSTDLLSRVDHLVYATSDLNRGVGEIERLLGVRPTPGGQHPGRGTRNALVALGPDVYLEIIAPDPDQPPPSQPRLFGIDDLRESRLVAWFSKGTDLERLRREATRNGVPLGEVRSGSRRRPDGVEVTWQFTDPLTPVADRIVPFFIDWGKSPHPAHDAAKGASLVALRAEHPDERGVQRMLRQLGLDLSVTHGPAPALIAIIDGPRGRVELR